MCGEGRRMVMMAIVWALLLSSVLGEDILFPNETWTSGYIQVEQEPGNELFYVLLEARGRQPNAPLLVWLNGGPGSSSMIGLFKEHGSSVIDRRSLVYRFNEDSWNTFADVLYVDQPIGVGFTFVRNNESYCNNMTCVATHFYNFLTKFVQKYPKYIGRPLYLCGESFAGHYLPAIAVQLLKAGNPALNLSGLALGNPDVTGAPQIGAAPYFLYENGVITYGQYLQAKAAGLICQIAVLVGMRPAWIIELCDIERSTTLNVTNIYDISDNETYENMNEVMDRMLNNATIQRLLNVNMTYNMWSDPVYEHLWIDELVSSGPNIEYILNAKLNVLIYFGDKDAVCNWRDGEELTNALQWEGTEMFNRATYKVWPAEAPKPWGKYKKFKNLILLIMYDSGHMVPMNRPLPALAMIKQFVHQNFP